MLRIDTILIIFRSVNVASFHFPESPLLFCVVWLLAQAGSQRPDPPELELETVWTAQCGCWEPALGPLQEQFTL